MADELQFIGRRAVPCGFYIREDDTSIRMAKTSRTEPSYNNGAIGQMAKNWLDECDKAILETIFYCETCNMILETSDSDVERHKRNLPDTF